MSRTRTWIMKGDEIYRFAMTGTGAKKCSEKIDYKTNCKNVIYKTEVYFICDAGTLKGLED